MVIAPSVDLVEWLFLNYPTSRVDQSDLVRSSSLRASLTPCRPLGWLQLSTFKSLIFAVYLKVTSYNLTVPGDSQSVQFRIGNKICLLTKRRPPVLKWWNTFLIRGDIRDFTLNNICEVTVAYNNVDRDDIDIANTSIPLHTWHWQAE